MKSLERWIAPFMIHMLYMELSLQFGPVDDRACC